MQELMEALRARLSQHTPSSITPYKCPECRDTGWVETDPITRAVRRCACREAEEAENRIKSSGLAESLELMTFDSFVTKTDIQRRMKETASAYIDSMSEDRKPWLYIGGNPGSGKTHICTAVCGELLKRRIPVRYMQWVDAARELKAAINDDDFDDLIADFVNVRVLYIDDLLKQRYVPSPAFTEADIRLCFAILNARYIQNKATIISSEWDLVNQLLPADEGTFSRVYERSKRFRITVERKAENNYRLTA